jgi:hypothetical protein
MTGWAVADGRTVSFFRKRTVWFLGLTIGLGPDDVDVPYV